MTKPNILLITIDCWRFDRLGQQTRNLQELAAEGVSFQSAYTNGGWTQAAFPALLTSTYASMYEGCLGPLAERRPSLPEWLQSQGYGTFAVQTSPLLDRRFGYGRGLNEYLQIEPPWQPPSWYKTKGIQRLLRKTGLHRLAQLAHFESRPAPIYANAEMATDRAIAMLDSPQEPFFLWVHYMDPHWPYFDQEALNSPQDLAKSWQDRQLGYLVMMREVRPSPENLTQWIKMYDEALQTVDEQVGRLLHAVDQQVGDNVLIIATADHGEEFYEHGNLGHASGSFYEEIVHIPLLIVGPKQFQPKVVHTPVSLLDVAPTVADLLKSEIPELMLGDSLLPLMIESTQERWPPRAIFTEFHRSDLGVGVCLFAIKVDNYKFVIDIRKPDDWRLYNLHDDPKEKNNLRGITGNNVPDFSSLLAQHIAAAQSTKTAVAKSPQIDNELLQRMHDLGYLD